jgi:mannosyl-3-phosphoglycerate synthase
MRIELPKEVERLGTVKFGALQRVFELDSGLKKGNGSVRGSAIVQIPYESLYEIQKQMAIVVPVRNERLKLIEGVLCGIPHQCLTIVVSNSPRQPVDRFHMEKDALIDFGNFTDKTIIMVHQKDEILTEAFKKVGYKQILDRQGRIRDGKAEGMIIGTILAWLIGKKYIGFIDADNYFPGAVAEYVREYAAGFHISKSSYSMVRISWHSKPKIMESKIFFRKWGRTSENTNRILNQLISHYTGYETEILKTGNAGEHAMTLNLATALDYSSGFSIEPYHIVNLMEKFGGIVGSPLPEVMKNSVEVYQIESRNPHLHEAGDEQHIASMSSEAMRCIYHSPVCPSEMKGKLLSDMRRRRLISDHKEPPKVRRYPSLANIDRDAFRENLNSAPYAHLVKAENA